KSPPPIVTAQTPSGSTHIRSFAHRRAHITPSQEQAIAEWLPRWSIRYQDKPIDLAAAFGRPAPVILEIGFGMGETTQKIAQARPTFLAASFGRPAPMILEIGFGMGETTRKIAQARPGDNFLGVEVFNAGVGALLKRIHENGLDNIRIIQHDAVEVLRDMIAP